MSNDTIKLLIKAITALLIVCIIAYLALKKPTKAAIDMRNKSITFDTSEANKSNKPIEKNSSVNANQKIDKIEGNVTGINAKDLDSTDEQTKYNVNQEIKTVKGNVTGVDLSKTKEVNK
ncbi:hypothetical protein OR1_01734 [Geobacter sp. OR-1]|uniref:hypothetical protein n=1 Tax=Geobacter sp. OR-1 TaxID=1266765 RepID=UPI000542B892|nr:hypothetical protein [Geobacter sp. OR-1]GAM09455.1 hypothetical protein OR1_01734 [Geobacter sp. OR-1]